MIKHAWVLLVAGGFGVANAPLAVGADDLRLWYEKPAVKWEEANPLGNGRLGAMVFGGVQTEQIQLNEDTLYSGYPGYRDVKLDIRKDFSTMTNLIAQRRFAEADRLATARWLGAAQACYQPLGDLYLDFEHAAENSGYVRELDLATAVWRTRYQAGGVNYTREIFASHPDDLLVVRLTADQPGALNFRIRTTSPHSNAVAQAKAPTLGLQGQVPGFVLRRELKTVETRQDTWKYPLLWDAQGNRRPEAQTVIYDGRGMYFDLRVRVQLRGGRVDSAGEGLRVSGSEEVVLLIAAASSFNGFDKDPVKEGVNPVSRTERTLKRASRHSYTELMDRHVRDYRELFDRVSLRLGGESESGGKPTDERIRRFGEGQDPALAALYFQFGRYLMISGSRPGSQPLNLQGIWNPHIIPPWAGAYTVNINAQMNYWPAELCNLSECHEPLLRMTRELSVDGRKVAREVYGRRGWVAHHNTTIWRDAQPVDGAAQASYWPMAAPWFCQHLFEHYRFTGDRKFLKGAYPVMKGAAEFMLDWLVENEQRRLVTPVSTSPENNFLYEDETGKKQRAAVSAGCTMDLALIRDLFTNTIRAAEILSMDQLFRTKLETTLAKLLPYQVGANGRLQEWQEDFADAEPAHRHVSHLLALHPGADITVRGTPELAAAARRTLELRGDGGTGWSKAWKVNFWARLADGDHAFKMLSELISKSTMPNMFDTHPPFQIDGNFGGCSGVGEMLLQSHSGEVELLPALPSAWPSGSIKGLRARGGFAVDISWREGRLVEAKIVSAIGEPLRLRYGERTLACETRPGQVLTFSSRDLRRNN